MSSAQVMVTGLKGNAAEVNRRGMSEVFVTKIETDRAEASVLNDEQEKLKAELKSKSAALDAKMAELEKGLSEAKKVVKLGFPQNQWRQFGMEDKR